MLEVYNEMIHDLLSTNRSSRFDIPSLDVAFDPPLDPASCHPQILFFFLFKKSNVLIF
jgi:hypothetical protein